MAASRNNPPASLAGRVGAFLAARLSSTETICVGLSGGCDSVVLLHLAAHLGLGERLRALHVDHGLSPNAGSWAARCAEYCAGLGVPLVVKAVAVDRSAGVGLEAAARAARYAAFADCGCDVLLLGHHRGDQAETLLFNLLRGSGVAGAAAIAEERRQGGLRILRPLLAIARDEIAAYACDNGLSWSEDESNADVALARNFIRHEVMPLLARRFPAAEANLARAADHFGEAANLLGELAELDWQAAAVGGELRLDRVRALSPTRLANLIRHRLRVLGWQVPVSARLDEFCRQLLVAGADRHPELCLPAGRMVAGRGHLRWIARG
jgi:tRNA(Ile)-lysidine synthase